MRDNIKVMKKSSTLQILTVSSEQEFTLMYPFFSSTLPQCHNIDITSHILLK